jgi:DegV family protein with EDD domain
MVKFCIATDSGCDIPAEYCRERKIYAYCMPYTIDEVEYFDYMEPGNIKQFYDQMRQGELPATSQMTPYEFIEFWTRIYNENNLPIVHIAMGSAISGTYANAKIAKEIFLKSNPQAEVYIIDSTLASIGYGMLCIWAADIRDMGKSQQECIEYLENKKPYINTYYTTDDLKYLYHSGRVHKSKAIIATTFSINPLLNLDKEGHLIVREKIRGRKRALNRICEIINKRVTDPENQIVYICHSDCPDKEVRTFSDTLINKYKFKNSFISYIGPTIGCHSGPGLIAAFFLGQVRFM